MWNYPPIILASESPRRSSILSQLKIPHTILAPQIEESCDLTRPDLYVCFLAEQKARKAQKILGETKLQNEIIISSDTIVAIPKTNNADTTEYSILGKPTDKQEANNMLTALSGKMHVVFTGICVLSTHGLTCKHDSTKVFFSCIDTTMINKYLSTNEWQGVAGAYAIQGLGASFISYIEGNYSTVMGLSIPLVLELLQQFQL